MCDSGVAISPITSGCPLAVKTCIAAGTVGIGGHAQIGTQALQGVGPLVRQAGGRLAGDRRLLDGQVQLGDGVQLGIGVRHGLADLAVGIGPQGLNLGRHGAQIGGQAIQLADHQSLQRTVFRRDRHLGERRLDGAQFGG